MCEQGISLFFQNLTAARWALKICVLEFTLACKICPDLTNMTRQQMAMFTAAFPHYRRAKPRHGAGLTGEAER